MCPHHNWLKETNEGAEATPLLHQGTAHRLLLSLLHQQAHVGHILHGTVELWLQVPSPWVGEGAAVGERCLSNERAETDTGR